MAKYSIRNTDLRRRNNHSRFIGLPPLNPSKLDLRSRNRYSNGNTSLCNNSRRFKDHHRSSNNNNKGSSTWRRLIQSWEAKANSTFNRLRSLLHHSPIFNINSRLPNSQHPLPRARPPPQDRMEQDRLRWVLLVVNRCPTASRSYDISSNDCYFLDMPPSANMMMEGVL